MQRNMNLAELPVAITGHEKYVETLPQKVLPATLA
jgi:hypothetical protein